jgi:hypothetical protein
MTNLNKTDVKNSIRRFNNWTLKKAIKFVEENGTELEKYRLGYLLGKERDNEVPLRYLRNLQNPDGGSL